MKLNIDSTQLNTDWLKTFNADFPNGITLEEAQHAEDQNLPVTKAPNWGTVVVKDWNEEDHPREPAGSPEGGQFAGGGGGSRATGLTDFQKSVLADYTRAQPLDNPLWLTPSTWDKLPEHQESLKLRAAVAKTAVDAWKSLHPGENPVTMEHNEPAAAMKEVMERQLSKTLMGEMPPEYWDKQITFHELLGKLDAATGWENPNNSTADEVARLKGEILAALPMPSQSEYYNEMQWFRDGIEKADTPGDLHWALTAAGSYGPAQTVVVTQAAHEALMTVLPPTDKDREEQAYLVARQYIEAWAHSSSDHNQNSVGLQEAAERVLGAASNKSFDSTTSAVASRDPDNRHIADALVKTIYDNTQQYLKDNNITEVAVHRGMDFFERDSAAKAMAIATSPDNGFSPVIEMGEQRLYVSERTPIESNPLSSYSTDVSSAHDFATRDFLGSTDKASMVVHTIVPAKAIFSLPATGVGCLSENEVVVISRPDAHATVELRVVPR